ncbi:helix-hairpin-helix domain-containing protein [Prevotella brunnea]|uniref:Helix-hairpin-helix domain-containing protein n=1 Tax=Prevotella brunnea TaxID=2508867 RepID=A0A5C8GFD2_9BACT|nr:helix-hairpin-helix domain-containing protein [Prevotella brunnea]TXJ60459.1 helix-hairpin-helix domain-containing protein [Prevotella brunnea]
MNFRDFFYLQKSDRKAVLFLLSLAAAVIIAVYLLGNDNNRTIGGADNEDTHFKRGAASERNGNPKEAYRFTESRHVKPFPFDPNTANGEELERLGLAPYQIRNIYKYRAKGGVFRSPQDFAKIYGLTRKQYRALEPYITIGDDYEPAFTLASVRAYHENKLAERERIHEAYEAYKAQDAYQPYKKYDRDTIRYPLKIKVNEHINLAVADTTLLKKVPGIGSGWARAIVSYGKRLGGYVSVGQLKEIEDFPEESLPFFEVRNPHTQKLNLNKLSLNQLRRHPYINFYMARDILDYRRLNGNLSSLSQLRLLKNFPPDVIKRLQPYVTF